MATKYDPPAPLTRAIGNADVATLRKVLTSMCRNSKECIAEASRLMLVQNTPAPAGVRTKRKGAEDESATRSRYEVCKTCDKMFDVSKNGPKACQTHDGMLEVDPDAFPDDDDIQSGEYIDTEKDWRVKEFPHGFVWDCCEATADEEPCVVGRHIARD